MKQLLFSILFLLFGLHGVGQQNVKQEFLTLLTSKSTSTIKEKAEILEKSYSKVEMAYYRLLIKNLPKQSYLITNSQDDTYPLHILQIVHNIRPDIKIIGLKLLNNQAYLDHVNQTYRLKLKANNSSKNIGIISTNSKNTFISSTVSSKYLFRSNYYLIGLAVQPSKVISNNQLLKFYIQLKQSNIQQLKWSKTDVKLLSNLLPPLITLYLTDKSKVDLKNDIMVLAKALKVESKVKIILNNSG